jgi:anti-anti-sigma regulatory factor/anti-sigma regulatory factor (Ser/Thr protein kinase)
MRIEQSVRNGYLVLALAGLLDLVGATRLHRVLLKALSQPPAAIVCDLSRLDQVDPSCAGIFTAVRHPALGWPGTTLVLCAPGPAVATTLASVRVTGCLPVYDSLDEALDRARERPPSLHDHIALAPVPDAASKARRFVRRVCSSWALDELVETVTLLANELVTNAIVHARTRIDLRLELRGRRLYVNVRDHDPRPVRSGTADERAESSRGLVIVDRAAKAWGVDDHPGGGKVVWCALDVPKAPPAHA